MKDSRSSIVHELAASIRQLERSRHRFNRDERAVMSTGIQSLDVLLPHQGLLRGTLTEWISKTIGSGAMTLATITAREAQRSGPVLVVDPLHCFHAPAAELLSLELNSMTIVRPQNRPDTLWAMEQALRCNAVGAVLGSVQQVSPREFRRLQLAAESGNSIGLLVRSGVGRRQTTWADIRLQVEPVSAIGLAHARRLQVNVLHAKGCYRESTVMLDVCDETAAVRVVAELSVATVSSRAAGA